MLSCVRWRWVHPPQPQETNRLHDRARVFDVGANHPLWRWKNRLPSLTYWHPSSALRHRRHCCNGRCPVFQRTTLDACLRREQQPGSCRHPSAFLEENLGSSHDPASAHRPPKFHLSKDHGRKDHSLRPSNPHRPAPLLHRCCQPKLLEVLCRLLLLHFRLPVSVPSRWNRHGVARGRSGAPMATVIATGRTSQEGSIHPGEGRGRGRAAASPYCRELEPRTDCRLLAIRFCCLGSVVVASAALAARPWLCLVAAAAGSADSARADLPPAYANAVVTDGPEGSTVALSAADHSRDFVGWPVLVVFVGRTPPLSVSSSPTSGWWAEVVSYSKGRMEWVCRCQNRALPAA